MSIDGFLYSKSTTKLSKINNFLRTRQYPTSSNSLTKSACLKPGEERQPHAGGGPLSRDSQDRGFARFVNKKSPDFLQHLTTNPYECAQMVVHCSVGLRHRLRNVRLLVPATA